GLEQSTEHRRPPGVQYGCDCADAGPGAGTQRVGPATPATGRAGPGRAMGSGWPDVADHPAPARALRMDPAMAAHDRGFCREAPATVVLDRGIRRDVGGSRVADHAASTEAGIRGNGRARTRRATARRARFARHAAARLHAT